MCAPMGAQKLQNVTIRHRLPKFFKKAKTRDLDLLGGKCVVFKKSAYHK